jgi:hypothetical protein
MDLVRPWTWSGRGLGQAVDLVRPWTWSGRGLCDATRAVRDRSRTRETREQGGSRTQNMSDNEAARARLF